MKYKLNKNTHLVKDLLLLVRKLDLTRRNNLLHANLKKYYETHDESYLDICEPQESLYQRERTAIRKWGEVPKKRRDRATNVFNIAVANANLALDLGENDSGSIDRRIIWRGVTKAETTRIPAVGTDSFDIAHIVRLEAVGVVLMEKVPELLAISSELGLPVIAIFKVPTIDNAFRATWVTSKDGEIKRVQGWIYYSSVHNIAYHSTVSLADAVNGLIRAVEALESNSSPSLNSKSSSALS